MARVQQPQRMPQDVRAFAAAQAGMAAKGAEFRAGGGDIHVPVPSPKGAA